MEALVHVRSVMSAVSEADIAGEVDADKSLEDLITLSDGDTNHIYRVTDNGEIVGQIDMKDLVRALVPRASSSASAAR